ncbi:MAG: hypothetical protein AABX30_00895 [Nanoarchaeota archaeon]
MNKIKRGLEKNNRGQIQLSFGMIFSIILIIVFIAFAFYVIWILLNNRDIGSIAVFTNDFQKDINKVWSSDSASQEKTYSLPEDAEKVCFIDDSKIYFEPRASGGDFNYFEIEHINIAKMNENGEFCLDVVNGKVNLILKKDEGDELVLIEESE